MARGGECVETIMNVIVHDRGDQTTFIIFPFQKCYTPLSSPLLPSTFPKLLPLPLPQKLILQGARNKKKERNKRI